MKKLLISIVSSIFLFVLTSFTLPSRVSAHCDTLDGPVVTAAKKALKTDNVNYILIWVKPENEDEIKKALKKARARKRLAKTKQEKEKAEMEVFKTLVRIHREGEGAKYEGIKPAGQIEPELAMADKAVETGKLDKILNHIKSPKNREIILHLFHEIKEKSHYDVDDVPAGREFIESYVIFIHAVEKAIKGVVLQKSKLHGH